jgi:PAS domain S-box-containing protein
VKTGEVPADKALTGPARSGGPSERRVRTHFLSTDFVLPFAIGVVAYIAMLELWLWRRGRGEAAHQWVATWCLATLGFQLGRFFQLHAEFPDEAIRTARLQIAMTPLLISSLLGFSRTLVPPAPRLDASTAFNLANIGLALVAATSPWFAGPETGVRHDWFGHAYVAVPSRAPMLIFVPYCLAAFVVFVRRVLTSPTLERSERGVLLGSFGLYLAMGMLSIFSSLGWVRYPMLSEYGPLVIAIGLHHLLVQRHRRLREWLEERVAAAQGELSATDAQRIESEERYRQLVENAPLGVIACDREGNVLTVNPHLLQVLGSPSAEATRAFNVLRLPALAEAGVGRLFLHVMETEQPTSVELAYTSQWGKSSHLRVVAAALRDATGRVSGVQAIVEDVSERVALEEKLRESHKMESVGRLAAGLAHEINNPMAYVRSNLTQLRGALDLVRSKLDGLRIASADPLRDAEELVDEALEGVERTVAIVREVREFSHAGRRREPVDVNEVIEAALRMTERERADGVRIERALAARAPVPGSSDQLCQVMVNLLSNAFQAVGAYGRVRIGSHEEAGLVVVRVEDDGPGIAPDARTRLFEPFFTTKAAGHGTGLGLYLSYEIVRSHAGEIRVESPGEAGAVFEVRLPASPDAAR